MAITVQLLRAHEHFYTSFVYKSRKEASHYCHLCLTAKHISCCYVYVQKVIVHCSCSVFHKLIPKQVMKDKRLLVHKNVLKGWARINRLQQSESYLACIFKSRILSVFYFWAIICLNLKAASREMTGAQGRKRSNIPRLIFSHSCHSWSAP